MLPTSKTFPCMLHTLSHQNTPRFGMTGETTISQIIPNWNAKMVQKNSFITVVWRTHTSPQTMTPQQELNAPSCQFLSHVKSQMQNEFVLHGKTYMNWMSICTYTVEGMVLHHIWFLPPRVRFMLPSIPFQLGANQRVNNFYNINDCESATRTHLLQCLWPVCWGQYLCESIGKQLWRFAISKLQRFLESKIWQILAMLTLWTRLQCRNLAEYLFWIILITASLSCSSITGVSCSSRYSNVSWICNVSPNIVDANG